jgi:hypothetical protein
VGPLLFFGFGYVAQEVASYRRGLDLSSYSLLGLVSVYLLYALVPLSLLLLPLLLGHLMAGLDPKETELLLPNYWRPLCLAAVLPSCALVQVSIDAWWYPFNLGMYLGSLFLVHVLAALLQILVVLLAGALLASSVRACEATALGCDDNDVMAATTSAARCLAAARQQLRITSLLGPFYMFFFAANCFALMFYTFDIYYMVEGLSGPTVGLLVYAFAALGT